MSEQLKDQGQTNSISAYDEMYLRAEATGEAMGPLRVITNDNYESQLVCVDIAIKREPYSRYSQARKETTFLNVEWVLPKGNPIPHVVKGDILHLEGDIYIKSWKAKSGEMNKTPVLRVRLFNKMERDV